jgi:hypothetical protein
MELKDNKMKKLILILVILIFPIALLGQGDIGLNLAQDLKLATVGDDKGNDAFTPNFIVRVDLQDNQATYGYMVGGVEYEHAALKGGAYNRYSLNFGYTFNRFRVFNNNKFELTILGNYGMTIRDSQIRDVINGVVINDRTIKSAYAGFAGSTTLAYPIADTGLSVVAIGQLSHRVDKNTLYGNDANYTIQGLQLDASGFLGLQYSFKLKPIRKF